MSNIKRWIWCFIFALALIILLYGFCIFMAYNTNFCDSFCNFFHTKFTFRDNPKGMIQFALIQSIVAIPGTTCLLRFALWYAENFDGE